MKKIYAIKVNESYLSKYEDFEAVLTDTIKEAILFSDKDKALEINEKIQLVFDNSSVVEISFREKSDPKTFSKKGLFVIKYDNDNYWTWNYFGLCNESSSISKDSFFDNYKDCYKRIKMDKLNAKVVELYI